jgi:hypothetical protein
MDGMGLRSTEAMERQFATTRKGRTAPANLREQVAPAMWPTPSANKMTKNSKDPQRMKEGGVQTCLADAAWIANKAMWPTPTSRDGKDTGDLSNSMVRKDGKSRMDTLARLTFDGSLAQTGKPAALALGFVAWLMGYNVLQLESMKKAMESYKRKKINAKPPKERSLETMQDVRGNDGAETHKWAPRRHGRIQQAQSLQLVVCEHEGGCQDGNLSAEGAEFQEGFMRKVWGYGDASCSSHRPQPEEQCSPELADVMRHLSSQISLGKWSQEAEKITPLQSLRKAFKETGYVSETLPEIQATWESATNETREQIVRNLLCERSYFWEPIHLLESGVKHRRAILHAFGNAIVPQVAAQFIQAATLTTEREDVRR